MSIINRDLFNASLVKLQSQRQAPPPTHDQGVREACECVRRREKKQEGRGTEPKAGAGAEEWERVRDRREQNQGTRRREASGGRKRPRGWVGHGPRGRKPRREDDKSRARRQARGPPSLAASVPGPGSAPSKPLLKLLLVGARRPCRKAAKLEGSRGPDTREVWLRRDRGHCPVPWPPPASPPDLG